MPTEYNVTSPLSGKVYRLKFDGDAGESDLNDAIDHIRNSESDTGQGKVEASLMAVPRAIGQGALSTVEGVGDVFKLSDVSEGARAGKESVAQMFPVNPALENSAGVKVGGLVGQVGEQIAETLSGAKALSLLGLAGGTAAKAAFLAPSFFKGADAGEDTARQYGLTSGAERAVTLGGGLIEAATEAFGTKYIPGLKDVGGSALETAVARNLFNKGAAKVLEESGVKLISKGFISEGLEEVESGIANDSLVRLLAPKDPNDPTKSANGQTLPNPLSLSNRTEDFVLGGLGGLLYAGPAAFANRSTPRRMIDVVGPDGQKIPQHIPDNVTDEQLKSFGIDPSAVRVATPDEEKLGDVWDVSHSLAQVTAQKAELTAKDSLSDEDKATLSDLNNIEKSLTGYLTKQGSENRIKQAQDLASSGTPEGLDAAVNAMADARSIVEKGGQLIDVNMQDFAGPGDENLGLDAPETQPTITQNGQQEETVQGRQGNEGLLSSPVEASSVASPVETPAGDVVAPNITLEPANVTHEPVNVTPAVTQKAMEKLGEGRDLTKWSPEELQLAQRVAEGDNEAFHDLPPIKQRAVQESVDREIPKSFKRLVAAGTTQAPVSQFNMGVGDVVTVNGKHFRVEGAKAGKVDLYNPDFGVNTVSADAVLPIENHIPASAANLLKGDDAMAKNVDKQLKRLSDAVGGVPIRLVTSEQMMKFIQDHSGDAGMSLGERGPKGVYESRTKPTILVNTGEASGDTPVHEAVGHVFMPWVAKNNPQIWNRGVELLNQNKNYLNAIRVAYFDQIEEVRRTQGDAAAESYLHEEALATVLGKRGQDIWQSSNSSRSLLSQLRAWVERVLTMFKRWAANKGLLGARQQAMWKSDFGIRGMTLDEWARNANLAVRTGAFKDQVDVKTTSNDPKLSKSSDDEYAKAVESGDVAKQQALVDAAAKAAGYNVGPAFHGSRQSFTTFKKGDLGFHFGLSEDQVFGETGRFSNTDPSLVRLYRVFADLKNPIELTDRGSWDGPQTIKEINQVTGLSISESANVSDVRAALKENGIDGVTYENLHEGDEGSRAIIVLDPNQIKSADPVTYDDKGKVVPLSQRFNKASNDIRFSKSELQPSALAKGKVDQLPEGAEKGVLTELQQLRESQSTDKAAAQIEKLYKANDGQGVDVHIAAIQSLYERVAATGADVSQDEIEGSDKYAFDAAPGLYYGKVLQGLRQQFAAGTPAQRRAAIAGMTDLGIAMAPFAARAGRQLQAFNEAYNRYAFPELAVEVMNRNFIFGSAKEAKAFEAEMDEVRKNMMAFYKEQIAVANADPVAKERMRANLQRAFVASMHGEDIADHLEATIVGGSGEETLGDLLEKTIEGYTGKTKEVFDRWVKSVRRLKIINEMLADPSLRQSKESDIQNEIKLELLKELNGVPTRSVLLAKREQEIKAQQDASAEVEGLVEQATVRSPRVAGSSELNTPEGRISYGADQLALLAERILKPGKKRKVSAEQATRKTLDTLAAAIAAKMSAPLAKTGKPKTDRALRLAALMANPQEAWAIREEAGKKLEAWAKENGATFDRAALDVMLQTMVGKEFNATSENQPFTNEHAQAVLRDELKALKVDVRKIVMDGKQTNAAIDSVVAKVRARVQESYGGTEVADRMEEVLRSEWSKTLAERRTRIEKSEQRKSDQKDTAKDIREARAAQREKTAKEKWRRDPMVNAENARGNPTKADDLIAFMASRFGISSKVGPKFDLTQFLDTMSETARSSGIEKMTREIAQFLGYDQTQTERFVGPVLAAAMTKLDAKRQQRLDTVFNPKKVLKQKKSVLDRQVELMKLGALDHEAYANVLLGARGMKAMTPEFKARMAELIAQRDQMPENSLQRMEADLNILQAVAAARGIGVGSYLMETTMAHIFSGLGTHKINAISGAIGVWTDIPVMARATANQVKGLSAKEKLQVQQTVMKAALRGYTDQYARAAAKYILLTGHSHIEDPYTNFGGNNLEVMSRFPGAPMTLFGKDIPQNPLIAGASKYATVTKYVRRAMVATDIMNRASVWEATTALQAVPQAIDLLKAQGREVNGANLNAAIDEVNYGKGGREAAVVEAKAQVADEISKGEIKNDKTHINERIRQILREKLNKLDGMDVAERQNMIEEEGKYSTLAFDVPGAFGQVSKIMSDIADRTPLGRLFIPAIKVPIAALYRTMDWTPWAFLRYKVAKETGRASVTKYYQTKWKGDQKNPSKSLPEGRELSPMAIETLRLKGVIGVGMTTLLWALAATNWDDDDDKAHFYVTAQGPRDKQELARWRQRGFTPYSVRIAGFDFNYRESPLMAALLPIGAMSDAKRYDNGKYVKDIGSWAAATATMTAKSMADQAAFQSLQELLSVAAAGANGANGKEESVLAKAFQRVGSNIIAPNFFRAFNDIIYGPQDSRSRSWGAAMFQNIPFAPSLTGTSPAVNVFGDTIHEQRGGSLGEVSDFLAYRIASHPIDDPKMHFVSKMGISKLFTSRRKMDGTLVMDDYPMYREWAIKSGKLLKERLDDKTVSDFDSAFKSDKVEAMKEFDRFVSGLRKEALDEILNEKDQ